MKIAHGMKSLLKFTSRLFSPSAAGLYILLFALAIGVATFIENDFGTSAAQKIVFRSRWFELLLLLFGISLIANILRFRLVQQKKWAILTFHLAMIVILLGAGITRYFGQEGMMHIREDGSSDYFLSSETFLQMEVQDRDQKYAVAEPVHFASLGKNSFQQSYLFGGREVRVELEDFIPNPQEILVEDEQGVPTLKVVIGGENGREEYFVRSGDRARIRGTLFNFGNPAEAGAFNIAYRDGQLSFLTNMPFTQMQMANRQLDTIPPGKQSPLLLRSLYSNGLQSFVFGAFTEHGNTELISSSQKMTNSSLGGLALKVSLGDETRQVYLAGSKGMEGAPRSLALGDLRLSMSYGARRINLPFSIRLNDFIMDRYPGTNSASSYASEVTLIDPRTDLVRDQRIYMNNILNYKGYRFFQSSYDQDELGTYLSVNDDAWGTWVSYLGYFLLTVGMALTFFSSKSRFAQVARKLKKVRTPQTAVAGLAIGFFLCLPAFGRGSLPPELNMSVVDLGHAERFGNLVMQDHRGRIKPMDTYANELLRKLSRKETLYGLTAEQIILNMLARPEAWYSIPLIKVGDQSEIRQVLQTDEELAAYNDFFDERGEYKLREQVRSAFQMPNGDRGTLEKELLKLDEKVNICSMIFSGRFMRAFPVPGDASNHWESPADGHHQHQGDQPASYVEQFFPTYLSSLQAALREGQWEMPDRLLADLDRYQREYGRAIMPPDRKVRAEIFLNKLKVFGRVGAMYAVLGLAFLGLLFASVFRPELNLQRPFKIAFGLLVVSFAFHAFGLALRWYVSERAPWSNGYESMIYIGFTTQLAGMIFARRSIGGLAATCILSATILMVAGLSWLDPEITPLVPVLKSYWLTIHVSMEAGSYGFLMLGALIGALNLILMVLANARNRDRINRITKEMTLISEMTLIGGLFLISIGTYLGGVWANESWGRYWGWDAKETWALVTILVYAFILHMRFIPGFRGLYAFNVASLFGWASVMMTYFGVNYYLSGLHSYAAGDPIPVPPFVYYTVIALVAISLGALWKNRKYGFADIL